MYDRRTINLTSVVPDRIPQDAPEDQWNTGRNVFFRNGESLRAPGDSPTLPGATTGARAASFITVNGQGYWVYCTDSGIYAHDGSSEIDITGANWPATPGTVETVYSSCVLNGVVYFNASDRDPVYWNGDILANVQPLPDWPTDGRCITLRAHKNFLFAIGFISEGEQRVRWSDAAAAGEVPQSWTPAADNFAGFLDLAPLYSPCVEGETLRDSFLVYKQESIWSLDLVGGNEVFIARKLFHERGIAGPNAVTGGIDDVHLFVGADGDVQLTDGVTVSSVLDGRAQRFFYDDFAANVDRVFSAVTLSREKLGIIIYPQVGQTAGTQALLFDFASGAIGFRDMPDVLCAAEGGTLTDVGDANEWDADSDTWDSDQTPWSREVFGQTLDDVLIGGDFGFAMISSDANDFITGPVEASLSKQGLSFGDAQSRKLMGRVWPRVVGEIGQTLTFRFGGQEITGGPITLGPPQTFTIGQDTSIDVFQGGRFLSMEIESTGGSPWRMGSIDVEVKPVGNF